MLSETHRGCYRMNELGIVPFLLKKKLGQFIKLQLYRGRRLVSLLDIIYKFEN